MARQFLPVFFIALVVMLGSPGQAAEDSGSCVQAGVWVDPVTGDAVTRRHVIAEAVAGSIVVLGETHDNPEHHLWQYQTIAVLHAQAGAVTLGFEMFPRRVQSALDAWVAGELDAEAFLKAADWDRVWGFDAALYMPLFDFARINRLPMVALNVDRNLIAAVREKGWDAVPEAQREGVSDPAPPSSAYRAQLEQVFQEHLDRSDQDPDPDGLERFTDAQLTWDRAMAEALNDAASAPQRPLVIGIIGGGHVENRYGVPDQLAALGRTGITVLLPWDRGRDCDDLKSGLADAVFGLDPPHVSEGAPPWRPRLGVIINTVDGALRVIDVVDGSVAEAAGIVADDVIVSAASVPVIEADDLISVILRQAPGTWLPLVINRGGEILDVVAKFKGAP